VHWRDLHTSIFGRKPSFPKCHSIEEFTELFAVFEYSQVKNYALRRLSMQAMLSTALIKALKERLVPERVIEGVIKELVELRFLNDEEWTASFVRIQSSRKMGPRAIAQKLFYKGVKGKELEKALENSWGMDDQKSLIMELLQKKYAKRNLEDYKERQKVVAALVRKGFEFPAIQECIRNVEFE
jgi:regulatory protein